MKKILLTTVCAPFGINSDDCTEHVMPELFHAQVTRAQGIFSPRVTYISYGLEYIANNLQTPAVVLQYPTMRQFRRELKKGYAYVGINFVIATFDKMKKMSRAVREISPDTKIVLGGYGTMLPECEAYGDHICREEGVGFMRRLLNEEHGEAPLKHVVYSTRGKIAGVPSMKGAVVLAGLGCPHGCEFCATSHFHNRRHIPLLETGKDLYREIRRVQKELGDPNLPIGIIEEDFLMQHRRAAEFLDCVRRDTENPVRISCFASAYAAAKWDPDDLVRMGVEALWIGVESSKADYAKLRGIDVKALFERLHARGINTLASLILGHDFHTAENVWDDFEYLVSLKPSLTQFLILTPACSTPLFERLGNEGRLLDVPHTQWDGFHLVFDHPSISKPEMEQLILDAYDEEYRRLGPSILRYVDKQLAGYLRYRDSSDPLLKIRAEQYRQGCREALPVCSTAARNAPAADSADWILRLKKNIIAETGPEGLKNKMLSAAVPAFALLEKFRLRCTSYSQAQPLRTAYRMSSNLLHTVQLSGKGMLTIKPRPRSADHHAPLVIDLHGALDHLTAAKLSKRAVSYLNENSGNLAINFRGVTCIENKALLRFFKNLRAYRQRVKIISIDSLQSEMSDVVAFARKSFDVCIDAECIHDLSST